MNDITDVLASRLLGVAHIGFIVPGLEAALAEFKRVYGLDSAGVDIQPPLGESAATRFAFFTVAGLNFELIEPCSPHFKEQLLGMPSGGAGINHIAWRVDDIEKAVELLAARDIRPGHVTPDGIIAIGLRKMVYLDPATTGGQVIELIQYPPDGAA